ncbi:MAG: LytTR family DNA-binding domain-containing protein [Bacteroidota bacterium]
MINRLIKQLNAPFPEPDGPQATLRIALFSGLFVAFFLMLFQPFGLSGNHIPNKYLVLAGFGAITFVILLVDEFLIRPLFPLSGPQLTFGKWLIWTSWIILSIAIGNFLYVNSLYQFEGTTLALFLQFCFYTLAIGIFPCFVTGWINQARQTKRNLAEAEQLQLQLQVPPEELRRIQIFAQGRKQVIELDLPQLLYLESQDNYVLVHFLSKDGYQKELIRSTLRFQEEQLAHPELIRCHRSFIVNVQQIDQVEGNAQGLRLHLRDHEQQIPVSRKYIPAIRAAVKSLG